MILGFSPIVDDRAIAIFFPEHTRLRAHQNLFQTRRDADRFF